MSAWQGRRLLGEVYSTGKVVTRNIAPEEHHQACLHNRKHELRTTKLTLGTQAPFLQRLVSLFLTDRLQHHKWRIIVVLCKPQVLSLLRVSMAPMTNLEGPIAWAQNWA